LWRAVLGHPLIWWLAIDILTKERASTMREVMSDETSRAPPEPIEPPVIALQREHGLPS
jgi:hypothetical protein